MDKKPDKYDEAYDDIENIFDNEATKESCKRRIVAYLRRAFPSVPSDAESTDDAWALWDHCHFVKQAIDHPTYAYIPSNTEGDKAAALELERFAAARLERFRREVEAYGRARGLDTILGDIDAALKAEKEDAK